MSGLRRCAVVQRACGDHHPARQLERDDATGDANECCSLDRLLRSAPPQLSTFASVCKSHRELKVAEHCTSRCAPPPSLQGYACAAATTVARRRLMAPTTTPPATCSFASGAPPTTRLTPPLPPAATDTAGAAQRVQKWARGCVWSVWVCCAGGGSAPYSGMTCAVAVEQGSCLLAVR